MAQFVNDEVLVRRFYEADKDPLFNFALRLSNNRADAEDAVSHTFMMICDKKYTVKPDASFKTWSYTVARNVCLTKLRTRGRYYPLWLPKNNSESEIQVDMIDPAMSARDGLDQKEMAGIVQKAISKLPEDQKEALLLREYHGFNYEEIARVLNCSLDKVKILIYRARQQLKQVLPPVLLEEGGVK